MKKKIKKKKIAGKTQLASEHLFRGFVPAARLAVSICYASLSLFSATVLSLPLSHSVSHCPSGIFLGKKMQICFAASRTKN